MVSSVVVGQNSYVTVAETDTALDNKTRAGAWKFVSPDNKKRAIITATTLINRQTYQGEKSGVTIINTVTINAAGTGYAVNDILTVSGGTFDLAARVTVTAVGGSGEVQGVQLLDAGSYSVLPASPAATTGGGGSACTLDLTSTTQILEHPRIGLVDKNGVAVPSGLVASEIKEATIEYAFELSQDPDLETSESTGTNTKSVRAGSAGVTFFRAQDGTRFPSVVHELLKFFLAGFGSLSPPFASGTTVESQFDDDDIYSLTQGLA